MLLIVGCAGGKAADTVDKQAVQKAMDIFIQKKLADNDNVYDINGVETEFDYLHDGVNEKDGLFVSCADFKAGDDVYDVDYYVKKSNGKYTIVKEVYHKKNGEKVNKVLWEQ